MKVLLLGDASHYNRTLAEGLKRHGHEVCVASDGSTWMNTGRDVDLSRRLPGCFGGALLWARLHTTLRLKLQGWDVIQLCGPTFMRLRPSRLRTLLDGLRRHNGLVCLTAIGTDTAFVNMCKDPQGPLRYSEWAIDGVPTEYALSTRGRTVSMWQQPELSEYAQYVYDHVDGVITALYEYQLSMSRVITPERLAYGGIPVDTAAIKPTPIDAKTNKPISILLPSHIGREQEKGIPQLMRIAKVIESEFPDKVTVLPVHNLQYAEFLKRMARADIVFDQLYSYTPATTALLAMAMGKTVVTGAEKDFNDFQGCATPAINIDPRCPEAALPTIRQYLNREALAANALKAREYVVTHNDCEVVAQRYEDFWHKISHNNGKVS